MNDTTDQKQLTELVRLYFDGQTTLEQERWLRQALATTDSDEPLVQEARAVMGAAIHATLGTGDTRAGRSAGRRGSALRAASVAAALVVGAILTVLFLSRPQTADHGGDGSRDAQPEATMGECYAYVGNVRIDDSDVVYDLISEQLADMYLASESVEIALNMPQNPNVEQVTIDTI